MGITRREFLAVAGASFLPPVIAGADSTVILASGRLDGRRFGCCGEPRWVAEWINRQSGLLLTDLTVKIP